MRTMTENNYNDGLPEPNKRTPGSNYKHALRSMNRWLEENGEPFAFYEENEIYDEDQKEDDDTLMPRPKTHTGNSNWRRSKAALEDSTETAKSDD